MTDSLLYWLSAEYKRQLPRVASDAAAVSGYSASELTSSNPPASVYAAISKRFNAQQRRWQKNTRQAAERYGGRFADKNRQEALQAMRNNFKALGLRTELKTSRAANALAALSKTQTIDRLDNLLQGYLKNVMAIALQDFIRGESPNELKKHIKDAQRKIERKAGNDVRDISNKLTQGTVQQQQHDLGLHTCIWIHVPGSKYSRRTHELMNGKEYDDRVGLYDSDVKRNVLPGELPYCMCTSRVKLPDWLN